MKRPRARAVTMPGFFFLSILLLVVVATGTQPRVVERMSDKSGDPTAYEVHVRPDIRPIPGPPSGYDIVHIYPSTSHTQSETSICVNPNDASHFLVGVNAITNEPSPDFHQGYYYSFDRGVSWDGDNILPNVNDAGDPVVCIDLNGNAYFNYITWTSGMEVWVKKSTDGGVTWLTSVKIPNAGSTDKPHMVVDIVPGSPYAGYVYSAWTDFSQYPYPIKFSRSTNGGSSFVNAFNISGTTADYLAQGVNLEVGPNGAVYATWSIYEDGYLTEVGNGFNVSYDGGATWGTAFEIPGLNVQGIRGYLKTTNIRVNSFPVMGIDQNTGNIYIVWTDKRHGDPDTYFTRSTDDGATWRAPIRVNDDPIGNDKDQWFPWIDVGEDGTIGVVFYDSRNDPSNLYTTVYVAISYDQGETWENIRVMDHEFIPTPIPGCASGYQGDYNGIAVKDGSFFPCWCMPEPDGRGIYQAYFAEVPYRLPDVSISLDPDSVFVHRGGKLTMDITAVNNTESSITFKAWTDVILWNGKPWKGNPVIDTTQATLGAGASKTKHVGHGIPQNAPYATYTYRAYTAALDGTILDQDEFEFEVVPGAYGSGYYEDFDLVEGEFF
jgi:hypothetical protein